jgi:putative transcription factor
MITTDFDVSVIKKDPSQIKPNKNQIITEKKSSVNNRQSNSNVDLKQIENEKIKLPKVTREMSIIMQQKRNELKLTQKQLATKCNLKEDVIKQYEKGTAIVNQNDLTKINRVLNCDLKMPKSEKIKE